MPDGVQHSSGHTLRVAASSKVLRRYLAAFAAFSLAEWSTWIAVLVYAFDRGGATAAGVVSFAMLIPAAAFAPFAAALGDQLPRERLAFRGLAAQSTAMVATAITMLADAPALAVYAAATVAAALITITRPAHFSLLPRLSETPAQLTASNTATAVVENAGAVLGPASAAVLLAWSEPGVVWLTMGALLALASALIIPWRVGAIDGDVVTISGADLIRSGFEGFRTIARSREPRLLIGVAGTQTVVEGLVDVLLVALAIDVFQRGDAAVGLLNTALALGGLVGALASTVLIGRRRLAPAILAGGVAFGLGFAAAGSAATMALAMIALGIAGTGLSFTETAGRTLLQRLVEDRVLTRVFGAIEGSRMLGLALGALAAPALIAVLDERSAMIAAGLLLPAVLALRSRRLLKLDAGARVPQRSLELLRPVPMFAELDPVVLERVAAQLDPIEIATGETVITQGASGDRFYVVDRGELSVTVDGRSVANLATGDHFGEIALLRDVPRTATVVAITDCRLRALERDEFLEAVTGLPRAAVIAHEVAQHRMDEIDRGERSD